MRGHLRTTRTREVEKCDEKRNQTNSMEDMRVLPGDVWRWSAASWSWAIVSKYRPPHREAWGAWGGRGVEHQEVDMFWSPCHASLMHEVRPLNYKVHMIADCGLSGLRFDPP